MMEFMSVLSAFVIVEARKSNETRNMGEMSNGLDFYHSRFIEIPRPFSCVFYYPYKVAMRTEYISSDYFFFCWSRKIEYSILFCIHSFAHINKTSQWTTATVPLCMSLFLSLSLFLKCLCRLSVLMNASQVVLARHGDSFESVNYEIELWIKMVFVCWR